MSHILQLTDVHRSFGSPPVHACNGVSLSVDEGEFVAIVGPSGSGKSTLLNLIGTLDRPTSGSVCINGTDVSSLRDTELSGVRSSLIGFVFQQFHLTAGVSASSDPAARGRADRQPGFALGCVHRRAPARAQRGRHHHHRDYARQ